MSSVQPILRKSDNGIYAAHWSVDRRSMVKSMKTADPKIARERFARWLLMEGATPPDERTVGQCWEVYVAKHLHDTAAPGTIISAWKFLLSQFETQPASLLRQDQIDAYAAKRRIGALGKFGKSVGDASIRRELQSLLSVLRFNGLKPPVFRLPERSAPRDRWLDKAEIAKMREAAIDLYGRQSRAAIFFEIALATGARKTAICELTWDRVDFQTGIVHFDLPGRRTTKKRRVSVPMSSSLSSYLSEHLRFMGGMSGRSLVVEPPFAAWHVIHRIAQKAGVPHVSPHVLRHTAATHMARRGVPLFLIAKVLGNSVQVVEKTYARHAVGDLRDAVEQIGA